MVPEEVKLSLAPSGVVRVLSMLGAFLLVASVAGQIARLGFGHDYVKGFVPLFYVDRERNIPTYFSLLLLLTAALLLALTAVLEARGARSWWALLAFGFLVLGFDEAFHVHEGLIEPMRQVLGGGRLGPFSFAWVVPALILVLLLLLVFLRFLARLPAPTRRRFLLAAVLYVGGSIGMEMVGGWVFEQDGPNTWQFVAAVTIEEGMEMAGLIVFVWALCRRWADNGTEILIRFR